VGVIVVLLCDFSSRPELPTVPSISVVAGLFRLAEADWLFIGVLEAESEAHRLVNGCGIDAAGATFRDCVDDLV
jgi:hypothetical protein